MGWLLLLEGHLTDRKHFSLLSAEHFFFCFKVTRVKFARVWQSSKILINLSRILHFHKRTKRNKDLGIRKKIVSYERTLRGY